MYKKNKFKIIRQAISTEVADLSYAYLYNKRKTARFLFDVKWISPFTSEWGVWNDNQAPNTYCLYGDILMDTLLTRLKGKIEKETGYKKLQETYSYARMYKTGDVLHRHTDRSSCEVSATLNLGGQPWPIYIDPTGRKGQAGIKVDLTPGDILLYSGCDLEHWRDAFPGKDCGQLFLHYNDSSNPKAKEDLYDTRPFLGLPHWFRGVKLSPQKK